MEKISVIVSALNEEKVIEGTLKALRKQDYPNFEIILSDGKSKDKTIKIARKYVDHVVSSKDKNLGAGRNKGAKIAKGKILVFVDADTRLHPSTLTFIQKEISNGKIGGSFAVKFWDSDKKSELAADFFNLFYILHNLFLPSGYGPCMFFKKEVFWSVDGFSTNVIYEDQDIALKINKKLGKKIEFYKDIYVYQSARRVKSKGILRYSLAAIKFYFKDRLRMETKYHEEYHNAKRKKSI